MKQDKNLVNTGRLKMSKVEHNEKNIEILATEVTDAMDAD